jgi:hypothetical protein
LFAAVQPRASTFKSAGSKSNDTKLPITISLVRRRKYNNRIWRTHLGKVSRQRPGYGHNAPPVTDGKGMFVPFQTQRMPKRFCLNTQ